LGGLTFFAGFSRPARAVESRLMWPINSVPRCSLTKASWTTVPRPALAYSAKAREKVDSEGTSCRLLNPQIRGAQKALRKELVC